MKLLITPALRLDEEQQAALAEEHELLFIEHENLPVSAWPKDIDSCIVEGIVCNFFFLYHTLDELPALKFIQLTSAGLDRVPVEEIRCRGICLENAGATYAVPMAEWAVTKILDFYKQTDMFADQQVRRVWKKDRALRELAGDTVAIVGFGNVGRAVAQRLSSFDMCVLAVDIIPDVSGLADAWYSVEELPYVLSQADVVVLTLPLTDATQHIMSGEMFSCMKPTALLVNIARGGLVDEAALVEALQSERLAGAALDVFEQEPLSAESPLWDMPNVCVSPHNSFVGNGNQQRLFKLLMNNLHHI